MMTERLNKINEIINGHSVRLRDSYFSKNYIDIYNQIIIYCQDINELNFKQKIWHWANNKPGYYLCKCGAKTTFHKNWLDGYRRFCSPKCSQSERDTKEKRKKTTIEKYGVDNIAKADKIKKKQEKTNIEKWGTKSSAQNQSVKEKIKNNKKKTNGVHCYTDERESFR